MDRPPRTPTHLVTLLDVLPLLATAGYEREAEAGATCCARGLAHAPTWARLVDRRNGSHGRTRLSHAASNGREVRLQQLLRLGADPLTAASNGWLPVHYALTRPDNACAVPLIAVTPAPLLSRRVTWKSFPVLSASPIGVAAMTGHTRALEALLDRGVSATEPCARLKGGRKVVAPQPVPPLTLAAMHAHPAAVRLLLACGADPTCYIPAGGYVLESALYLSGSLHSSPGGSGDIRDTLLALLEAGADPTGSIPPPMPLAAGWSFTPSKPMEIVRVAVAAGQWAVAAALVRRGSIPPGNTAVMTRQLAACCRVRADSAQLGDPFELACALLDAGADVATGGRNDSSIAAAAASAGHLDMVQALLRRGASPNQHFSTVFCGQPCVMSALGMAVAGEFQPVLDALLEAGAEDAPAGARSAIEVALGGDHSHDSVLRLVRGLRELDATATPCASAMARAVAAGWVELVEVLLRRGADPNRALDDGGSYLHAASTSGHFGMVRALLAAGANVRARTHAGETPLDVAMRCKRHGVAVLLRAARTAGAAPRTRGGGAAPALPPSLLPPPPDTRDLDALLAEIEGPPEAASKAARRRKGKKGGGGGVAGAAADQAAVPATVSAPAAGAPPAAVPLGVLGGELVVGGGGAGEGDDEDGGAGIPSFVSMDDPATWTPEGDLTAAPPAAGGGEPVVTTGAPELAAALAAGVAEYRAAVRHAETVGARVAAAALSMRTAPSTVFPGAVLVAAEDCVATIAAASAAVEVLVAALAGAGAPLASSSPPVCTPNRRECPFSTRTATPAAAAVPPCPQTPPPPRPLLTASHYVLPYPPPAAPRPG